MRFMPTPPSPRGPLLPNVYPLSQEDFSGGLNLSKNGNDIENNEVQAARNMEYDSSGKTLIVRDGTVKVKTLANIPDGLFWSDSLDEFLYSFDGDLYEFTLADAEASVGALTGSGVPVFLPWSETGLPIIASGGKIQSYDGTTLLTITASPDVDVMAYKKGRLVVAHTGYDSLQFSGVGDISNWNFAGTFADAAEMEVGYKDAGDICGIAFLSRDTIVFKSNGYSYRIVGDPPAVETDTWACYEVSRRSKLMNRFCIANLEADALFFDAMGIRTLSTVMQYGDIQASSDIGAKVDPVLAFSASPTNARVWNLIRKGQVWVKPSGTNSIFVLNVASRAWTTFDFPFEVMAVADDGSDYFLAAGDKNVYRLDSDVATDDGIPISAFVRPRSIISPRPMVALAFGASMTARHGTGNAVLNLNRASMTKVFPATNDYAYSDEEFAYSDTDPVGPTETAVNMYRRCQIRTRNIIMDLRITGAKASLSRLDLEFGEV